MIDKDWLNEAIKGQAETEFGSKFENLPPQLSGDDSVRMNFQALIKTDEFKNFKESVLPVLKKQHTQEILQQLEGVKELLGGEE